MEKRTLGSTGLDVTVLGYGTGELRDPDNVSEVDAERVLNAVLDGGINFVDTAPDYGASEERIGKYISQRRSDYFLATKCGCNAAEDGTRGDPPHVWSREQLMANIEMSLRRLRTDYVDIWQLHNPPVAEVYAQELLEVMQEVKASGKVRHVSISTRLPEIDTYLQRNAFETYQIPYSALQRENEAAISRAAEIGAGVIIRGGVAQGESKANNAALWERWTSTGLAELAGAGESAAAYLLRFTITHPGMATTIVGTKNLEHLQQNLATAEQGALDAGAYAETKSRLDAS
jgi:aryl-alcohol dehydrogenase-like predicted oxidoreductase